MIAQLTNHLWQSTVFAAAVAVAAFLLRSNRAHVRYALWFAASMKFVVPFSLLLSLGALVPLRSAQPAATAVNPGSFSIAVDELAQPFAISAPAPSVPASRRVPWTSVAAAAWFTVLAAIVVVRLRGWRRIRRAVEASRPITLDGFDSLDVRSSPTMFEPGIVGLRRPILLVPEGITDRLTPRQLEAVVAHELCHVRRRDNLTAVVHMGVEAVCWFHPLVWWIGARMLAERERACDEAVLAQGLQPRDYADAILNVCKLCVESPLACVAGVTGSDLRKRLDDIIIERIGARLTLTRKAGLAAGAMAALLTPLAIGSITAPLRAQGQKADEKQTFEVASIKPCDATTQVPGGRSGGPGPNLSPDRLHIGCMSVAQLINIAYITNGERLLNDDPGYLQWSSADASARMVRGSERVRGGPAWARDEKFEIEAKASGATDRKVLQGPMLRALLEERFHLKIHRGEDQNVDMFALTVAKGGRKIQPWATDHECTEWDRATQKPPPMHEVIEMVRRGEKPPCGLGVMFGPRGSNTAFALNGQEMDGVAYWLSSAVGKHVVNRTGLTGKYTLYLEYAPEDNTTDPAGGSVFTAVQEQWGLKLEPAKGPRGYIVIDQVERPAPQSLPAAFDVASVRPCGDPEWIRRHPGAQMKTIDTGTRHVVLDCATPQTLINLAYTRRGGLRLNDHDLDRQVRGGPDWIRSERYTIEANSSVDLTAELMARMLQTLLRDRFQLRIGRAVEQVPMYALTVSKDGLRIKPIADGDCLPDDGDSAPPRGPGSSATKPTCGMTTGRERGTLRVWELNGSSLGALVDVLETDREILDRTGVAGRFNIHLEYSLAPDTVESSGPSVFQALRQQLGLDLVSTKGPHEYVRVEQIERPRAEG